MQYKMILLCVCLSGRVLAEEATFERFTNHPGIYLEEVGKAFLTGDEWKMVLFYDLESYWHEWESLTFILQRMTTACHLRGNTKLSKPENGSAEGSSSACGHMLDSVQLMMKGIENRNVLLKAPVRVKRAPLEFVGTFLNEAFGVLDQRTAVRYETQIRELQTGTLQMSQLVQQQTHVLEVTANLVRKQQDQIQQQYRQIQAEIRALTERAKFTDMVLQLTTHITLFKEMQEAMIDVMVDLHQGHINTKLLTPGQLEEQLKQMESWASPEVQIPDYKQHWVQLYQLLKAKARLVGNYLIFELRVPLFGIETYQVFVNHPAPTTIQGQMGYIEPTTEVLLVNLQRTYYYSMTPSELRVCLKWDQQHVICFQKGPLYFNQDSSKPCELGLLQHDETAISRCQVRTTMTQTYIRALNQPNAWLMSLAKEETMDVICNSTTQSINIQGTGLLKLKAGCLLKGRQFLLRSITTHATEQHMQFIPPFNLSQQIGPTVDLATTNLEPDVQKMMTAVQALHREESWYRLNIHDIPQYVLSGSLLIPVCILLIAWVRRRQLGQMLFQNSQHVTATQSTTSRLPALRRRSCSV